MMSIFVNFYSVCSEDDGSVDGCVGGRVDGCADGSVGDRTGCRVDGSADDGIMGGDCVDGCVSSILGTVFLCTLFFCNKCNTKSGNTATVFM